MNGRMTRHNFFERLERELDVQFEYEKIENIVLNERNMGMVLNEEIEQRFKRWSFKKNYASFDELRNHMGFTYSVLINRVRVPEGKIKNLDDFILYCEMILNMIYGVCSDFFPYDCPEPVDKVLGIIRYDIEKMNHCIHRMEDGGYLIVQKNAAASAVADIVTPELGDSIIEYNHHLLKGNLKEKQLILKMIADALEPRRKELRGVNSTLESDFFYMINCMNVRHNNCDASDKTKYKPQFAALTDKEKEEWYDEIYQEALMAFLSLEQVERNKKISDFKNAK